MSKKNKNKGKILVFPGGGNQRIEARPKKHAAPQLKGLKETKSPTIKKTGGDDPLGPLNETMDWPVPFLKEWSPTKRQWPLIAVAAVIAVMLFKDTRHIKQTLNDHKETLATMNKDIISFSEKSGASKNESLAVVTGPNKGDQKSSRDLALFNASGLKAEIGRAAEKAFLFWASILFFLAPAVIVYYAIKYWNDKKPSLKNI